MHRCIQCKTEYEGKFCPECGAPWQEEKTCPQCGATLSGSARFCNECGYAFVSTPPAQPMHQPPAQQQTVPKPHDPAIAQKAYAILRYVPMALMALFAVLLFAFAAAPVAVMVNPFGGKNIGLGNIYGSYREDLPELNGIVIALWISIALALLYAAVTVFLFFRKETKHKDINLFGKFRMGWGEAFGMGGFVFYLLFLILSAVVMGKLKALDDGLGLLKTGSFPILVLVFSILFALMAACVLTARCLLNKKNPQLGLEEAQRKLDAIAREVERRKAFYATHTPPELAQNATKKELCAYKHNRRRYEKAKEGSVSAGVVWLDRYKALLITVTAIVIALTVFLSIFLPWHSNIFRVGKAEKIEIGDGQGYVQKVLGKPYAGTKTDEKWEYYDKEYTKLLKKLEDKEQAIENAMLSGDLAQAEKLTAEGEQLAAKLRSKTYDYIEICFAQEESTSEYFVTSVLLDKGRNDSKEDKRKNVKKLTVGKTGSVSYYIDETVSEDACIILDCTFREKDSENINPIYTARYTDGSFYRGTIIGATATEIKNTEADIVWHDDFAEYAATTQAVKIGEVSEEGAWKTYARDIQAITLPNSVTSIGDSAFRGCTGLTSITIPQGVTEIGREVFYGCSGLTSIAIPNSVTSIGENTFSGCNIITATMPTNAIDYILKDHISKTNLQTVVINGGASIGEHAFNGCSGLTSITIPSSVTSIGSYAFYNCTGLTSITLPQGVTSIGNGAFSDCSGLTSIEIPSNVTSIGGGAFSGCSSLASIVIPNSVTIISSSAFWDCSALATIKYTGDIASWCGIEGLYNLMGYGASNKKLIINNQEITGALVIPQGVTSIGGGAFYGCIGLTDITIPSSVTSIESSAFGGCNGLIIYCEAASGASYGWNFSCPVVWNCKTNKKDTNGYEYDVIGGIRYGFKEGVAEVACQPQNISGAIALPASVTYGNTTFNVTSIRSSAFGGCSSLTSITISQGISSIGERAFYGCSGLISIMIPNTVTSIGERAFYGCSGLISIMIPNTVTSIGYSAFEGCSKLIQEENGVQYVDQWAIGCSKNAINVTLRAHTVGIVGSAFSECSRLTSITIPQGVTSIGNSAFWGCDRLTSVTLPSSVTSIGSSAFEYCSRLTSITIPQGVTSIGWGAFESCRGLTDIYCEAESKPSGWNEKWNYKCSARVHWGVRENA